LRHLAIAQIDGCRARTISMVVLVVLVAADVAQLISRSLLDVDGDRPTTR
jgi:hypothetical protein